MSDANLTAEQVAAIVKDAVGELRAEIQAEATKFSEEIEAKHGSVEAAKISGVETNFHAREGIGDSGGAMTAEERKRLFPQKTNFGRFATGIIQLARNGVSGQPALEALRKSSLEKGDIELSNSISRTLDSYQAKTSALTDFSSLGALVPEETSSEVIESVYADVIVSALGATHLPMPNGNLTMPYGKTGVNGSYGGETETIEAETPTVGQITMMAKKLRVIVDLSNDLLRTPTAGALAYVQSEILEGLARTADLQLMRGLGTDGNPKGFRQFVLDSTPGDRSFASGGTALSNKVSELGQLVRSVQETNVGERNAGFALDHRTSWGLRTTLSTDGQRVFEAAMAAGSLMGFPFKISTAMPTNIGSGGNKAEVIFGYWGHFLIGDTDTLEMTVAPNAAYVKNGVVRSGFSDDVTPVRAIMRHDTACRHRGKEGSILRDVAWA